MDSKKRRRGCLNSKDLYKLSVRDYNVVDKNTSKRLGTIQYLPQKNEQIVLAGRRWIVEGVNESGMVVYVNQAISGGKAFWGGDGPEIDGMIVEQMRNIYLSNECYPYLDVLLILLSNVLWNPNHSKFSGSPPAISSNNVSNLASTLSA